MPRPDRSNALDHVVALMFENRSFDNLLGRLYEPGEVASFEGVTGKDLSNPIPDWAADQGPGGGVVPYSVATDMNMPSPDPGEEHQHVNTQLYGSINPLTNRGLLAHHMTAPYNAPADVLLQPTMDGFVADYISAFTAEMGKEPHYAEYAQIMTGYTPDQLPVISALARGFATFDQFLQDCADGTLPTYSFIEPNLLYGHNDMHPAMDALFPDSPVDPPSSLLGGDALLAKIYNAIRTATSDSGSNVWNTLFLVTFDEHGGTYDHVPPPVVPTPETGGAPGQMGFGFQRSGVRIPAMAISPWIPAQTVVTDEYWNTSVIATLRQRWELGPPLTKRDAAAADLSPVFSLDTPRDPDGWPEVSPRPVPPYTGQIPAPDAAMRGLGKAAFHACAALTAHMGKSSPAFTQDMDITRADGAALMNDLAGDVFVRLHGK